MSINVTGLGQFTNYFTAPYLAGTYAFQTYDPLLANPYLNPFLLGQTKVNGEERTGSLDQLIGQAAFGINNQNFANPLGSGGALGSIGGLGGLFGSGLNLGSGNGGGLGSLFGGGGALDGGGGWGNPLAAFGSGFSGGGVGNPLGGGLFGVLNSAIGGNPFNSTPRNGLFGLAVEQYPTAGRLATLDPVYVNSENTERNSPLLGLILATGGLPGFLRNQLGLNA